MTGGGGGASGSSKVGTSGSSGETVGAWHDWRLLRMHDGAGGGGKMAALQQ